MVQKAVYRQKMMGKESLGSTMGESGASGRLMMGVDRANFVGMDGSVELRWVDWTMIHSHKTYTANSLTVAECKTVAGLAGRKDGLQSRLRRIRCRACQEGQAVEDLDLRSSHQMHLQREVAVHDIDFGCRKIEGLR